MKTLKGIKAKPEPLDPEQKLDGIPTYQTMMKYSVSMNLGKSAENSIECYQVGLKLKLDQDEIQLEDAEFKVLKEAVEANPMRYMAHFHGQLMLKIREWEKTGENK